jgi:hypothetical protein
MAITRMSSREFNQDTAKAKKAAKRGPVFERRDRSEGAILRTWMDDHVMPAFVGRVLPFDDVVARRCARLDVPDRRSDRDAMIAATALVHGMTVVTRNVADFIATGVPVLDPWSTTRG